MTPGLPPPATEIAGRALLEDWSAGTAISRAHPHTFGSVQLDKRPNANFRFSTIHQGRRVVPVAYGGENDHAAASETIFHTIETPTGAVRPRRVYLAKYLTWQWSSIHPTRDLHLVRLDDAGLTALGTTRTDLIETTRLAYPTTRAWAEAIAAALPTVDGLWWYSRQDPTRKALVLFGQLPDRPGGVARADLTSNEPALPFALPQGLDRLDQIADDFDVEVTRP
ncbi:MAG: RES domain-containing protein [Acidimicrobiales bacterium]